MRAHHRAHHHLHIARSNKSSGRCHKWWGRTKGQCLKIRRRPKESRKEKVPNGEIIRRHCWTTTNTHLELFLYMVKCSKFSRCFIKAGTFFFFQVFVHLKLCLSKKNIVLNMVLQTCYRDIIPLWDFDIVTSSFIIYLQSLSKRPLAPSKGSYLFCSR